MTNIEKLIQAKEKLIQAKELLISVRDGLETISLELGNAIRGAITRVNNAIEEINRS